MSVLFAVMFPVTQSLVKVVMTFSSVSACDISPRSNRYIVFRNQILEVLTLGVLCSLVQSKLLCAS